MRSPFPGMDPFLERHWEDVHQTLVIYARDAIQPRLPDDLWAVAEERVFVESDAERVLQIVPDVHVSVYPPPKSQPAMLKEGEAVAEPLIFESRALEIREGYIRIIDRVGGKVITVIEFLSPTNKSGGPGQNSYLEKQAEVLRSEASLVEVDLVRAGQRVLALPHYKIPAQHRRDYLACVSPGWKRSRRELYPMPLRQRLPILPFRCVSMNRLCLSIYRRWWNKPIPREGMIGLIIASNSIRPCPPKTRRGLRRFSRVRASGDLFPDEP